MADRKLIVPPEYIGGLEVNWVSATSISVSPGACFIPGLSTVVEVLSTITLSGLTIAANTVYYVYLTSVSGTSTVTLETTAPVTYREDAKTKTGDTTKRYLATIFSNASSQLVSFPKIVPNYSILEDFINESRNTLMSGGGNISWGIVANKFKWTQRFILLPMSDDASSSNFIDITMPTTGVTNAAGTEMASADGITMSATWDSLWFLHTRGSAFGTGNSFKVLSYTDALTDVYFNSREALLVAVRNSDAGNGSLYLRNGQVIPYGQTIQIGQPTPPVSFKSLLKAGI